MNTKLDPTASSFLLRLAAPSLAHQSGTNVGISDWHRPSHPSSLGASALVGLVKHSERRLRQTYYTHSFGICVVVLAAVIAVGFLGHMSSVFAFGSH